MYYAAGVNSPPSGSGSSPNPTLVTPENGYDYDGIILHAQAHRTGSFAILTTQGFWMWGDGTIDGNNAFSKVDLPSEIIPTRVKSMSITSGVSMSFVMVDGKVYTYSSIDASENGAGLTSTSTDFTEVKVSANTALENISDAVTASGGTFAYSSVNNTFYTWGKSTYLGDGSVAEKRTYATKMANPLPSGVEVVSIAATGNNVMNYFVLGSDQRVYSLGKNSSGVLGQGNTSESRTWLTVKNSAGAAPLEDVKFLSAQHASGNYPTVSVIQNNGQLLSWGSNNANTIGTGGDKSLPTTPNGISADDNLIAVANGGHITPVLRDDFYVGNVGHNVGGAFGDGTTANRSSYGFLEFIGTIPPPCQEDTDGDGIPNRLDLDSDNDGCPDAVESSVTRDIGTSVIPGPYGENGFADSIETEPESGGFDGDYTYDFAINDQVNLCLDTDNDGIPDYFDLDDDNDGILDHIESPDCFYTAEELGITDTDNFISSMYPKPDNCLSDDDGDGIPNHLDLDSDGDGCPDAYEAGSESLARSVFKPTSTGGIVSGPFGDNGLADYLETGEETGEYAGVYTYSDAIEAGSGSTVTQQPEDLEVFGDGQSATFTATVDTSNVSSPPIYQWQISTNGGASWNDVVDNQGYSGSQTFELTVNNITADMSGYRYRMSIVQNDFVCGNQNTDAAKLKVGDVPTAIDDIGVTEQEETLEGNILINDLDSEGNNNVTLTEFTIFDDSGEPLVISDNNGDPIENPFVLGEEVVMDGVGTITLNDDGSYTFIPVDGYYGKVPSIGYKISETDKGSDLGTLDITVTKINKAPVAADVTQNVDEDTPLSGNLLDNATDPDGDILEITEFTVDGVSYNAGTTVDMPDIGIIEVNNDGSYTFTPAPNYNGEVPPINYIVSDINGATDSAALAITVDPVNDAPLTVSEVVGISEGTTADGNLLDNDSDVDGDVLSISQFEVNGETVIVDVSDGGESAIEDEDGNEIGTISISADGVFEFVPLDEFREGDVPVITYTVSDGVEETTADLSIYVEPEPQVPTANDDTRTIDEDSNLACVDDVDADSSCNLLGNDEPDPLFPDLQLSINEISFSVDGELFTYPPGVDAVIPGVGTVNVNSDGTYSFTPNKDFNGEVPPIKYGITDGEGNTTDADLKITVDPVNDPPNAVDDNLLTRKNEAKEGNVLDNDSDVEENTLTVTQFEVGGVDVSTDNGGNAALTDPDGEEVGEITMNSDGSYEFIPSEDYVGPVPSIEYTVCDDGDPIECNTASLDISVTDFNIDPVANDLNTSTSDLIPAEGDLLENDIDGDGDELAVLNFTVNGITYPSDRVIDIEDLGTLTVDSDGTYAFVPVVGLDTVVEVDYTITDGFGGQDSATLYIDVDPVITPVDIKVTDINVPVSGDVSTNDLSPDGTTYGSPEPSEDNPEGAELTMNADGSYDFEATEPGVYEYMVPVCGPGQVLDCPLVPLQITVLDPKSDDNLPVANPDIATAKEETPVVIDVLSNDQSGNLWVSGHIRPIRSLNNK